MTTKMGDGDRPIPRVRQLLVVFGGYLVAMTIVGAFVFRRPVVPDGPDVFDRTYFGYATAFRVALCMCCGFVALLSSALVAHSRAARAITLVLFFTLAGLVEWFIHFGWSWTTTF